MVGSSGWWLSTLILKWDNPNFSKPSMLFRDFCTICAARVFCVGQHLLGGLIQASTIGLVVVSRRTFTDKNFWKFRHGFGLVEMDLLGVN